MAGQSVLDSLQGGKKVLGQKGNIIVLHEVIHIVSEFPGSPLHHMQMLGGASAHFAKCCWGKLNRENFAQPQPESCCTDAEEKLCSCQAKAKNVIE